MSFLGTIYRVLVVLAVVFVSNTRAVELRNCAKPVFMGVGSTLINKKKVTELFGEEYISARNQVIVGKAVTGALANTSSDSLATFRVIKSKGFFIGENGLDAKEKTILVVVENSAMVGYVAVNGALRLGGDYFSFNEKYIDQKCDEYLPENVAWIAKPVATFVVDLAYDYVTIELVKGFIGGRNKAD